MRIFKIAALAAFFSCPLVLAACASITPSNPAQAAANLQAKVVRICTVAQPVVGSMQAAETAPIEALDKAAGYVHSVCANTRTVDTANVTALVNSGVPLLISAIQQSHMNTDDKNVYSTALIGAQTAILLLLPPATPAATKQAK